MLGETATPADIARMNHEFGLDRPLVRQQYVTWLGNALHGDLGRSWFTTIPVVRQHHARRCRSTSRSPGWRWCWPS